MESPLVISVNRVQRPSEVFLRRAMAVLAGFFLLQGILFATSFMLPCFLMTAAYFVYRAASRREYEYTLEDGVFRIERVSDRGRRVLHEISFADVELVCLPDAPEAQPYKKKGGTVRLPKKDYTSYREGVPYYTVIATEEGKKMKFLLDLTSEAVARLRRRCHDAVRIPGSAG